MKANEDYAWLVHSAQSNPAISAPVRNALLSPSFLRSSVYRRIVILDLMTHQEREALILAFWERHKTRVRGTEGVLVKTVQRRLPAPLARDFLVCMASRGVLLRRVRNKSIGAYVRADSAPRSPFRAESFHRLVLRLARESGVDPWSVRLNNAFAGICLAFYSGRVRDEEVRIAFDTLINGAEYRAVARQARELRVSTRANHMYALVVAGAVKALGNGLYVLSSDYVYE